MAVRLGWSVHSSLGPSRSLETYGLEVVGRVIPTSDGVRSCLYQAAEAIVMATTRRRQASQAPSRWAMRSEPSGTELTTTGKRLDPDPEANSRHNVTSLHTRANNPSRRSVAEVVPGRQQQSLIGTAQSLRGGLRREEGNAVGIV